MRIYLSASAFPNEVSVKLLGARASTVTGSGSVVVETTIGAPDADDDAATDKRESSNNSSNCRSRSPRDDVDIMDVANRRSTLVMGFARKRHFRQSATVPEEGRHSLQIPGFLHFEQTSV